MIVFKTEKYVIKKYFFGWFRVYEGSRLHAKFKYKASAVNYLVMKKKQFREWSEFK